MIDTHRPIRLRDSGRRVYHTGWDTRDEVLWIGERDQWGLHAARYHIAGLPFDRNPWGVIENFDPLEEMMAGWEDVVNPAVARKCREEIEAVQDNPMFGMF